MSTVRTITVHNQLLDPTRLTIARDVETDRWFCTVNDIRLEAVESGHRDWYSRVQFSDGRYDIERGHGSMRSAFAHACVVALRGS